MRMILVGTALLSLCGGIWGCSAQSSEAPSHAAEVPQPGPAFIDEDPGPPPEGQTEPPMEDAIHPQDAVAVGEGEASAAEAKVSLAMTTWEDAQRFIASKTGQVVVIDLWSTTCVPCRREFPNLVTLHRDYGDKVACISYSMDYSGRAGHPPESYREQVLEFLIQQGATCDNLLGTDDPDALYARLDLAAIPAVYVYDREGELRKRFDNEDPDRKEFTYEADVIPFVEALLAEN